ncbi:glycoside hydrolase family 130 protein, partial [bacterium]|nr:glycoside hydrolase family 130 protein [bacterium]
KETNSIIIKEFDKTDPALDFSDPRTIKTPEGNYLTTISHLRIASSKNGIDFNIDKKPAMFPENIYERFGIEDPRITYIDGKYYIGYNAISDVTGITICLASTVDYISFRRHGVIFMPDNKDFALFPEKIGEKYFALNRPTSAEFCKRDIWISQSSDLISWGSHRIMMTTRKGYWDNGWIGCGGVPFRIDEGWLEIYHGASEDDIYRIGAVLLDLSEPSKILARSEKPIIEPHELYEKKGFLENIIFTCGVLYEEGKVKIYYGAADTSIAYSEINLGDILSGLG